MLMTTFRLATGAGQALLKLSTAEVEGAALCGNATCDPTKTTDSTTVRATNAVNTLLRVHRWSAITSPEPADGGLAIGGQVKTLPTTSVHRHLCFSLHSIPVRNSHFSYTELSSALP